MEGVPACLLALSAAAPRLVRAPVRPRPPLHPGGCYRGAALPPPPASRGDQPGPRPGQAQKPRGDARGEPPRCGPRGRLRRLGPAWPPPRAAVVTARVPAGIRNRSRLPALPCPPRSARAKLRALPLSPSGAQGRTGAPAVLARCRPGMLTSRGRARKVSQGWVGTVCFALPFQRMLKWRSVAGRQQSVVWGLR